eukprot:6058971-Alexandrium_andersonii.AAC.1
MLEVATVVAWWCAALAMARSLGGSRQGGRESAGDRESRDLGLRKVEVSAVATKAHAVVRAR